MSYFDHVRCQHCNTQLDPDRLSAGMNCPACGQALDLKSLFGVADAFTGVDEGGADVSLDDLMAPQRAYADDPMADFARAQHEAQEARRQAKAEGRRPRPAAPSRPAAPAGSTGLVHQPRHDDDDDDVGGSPSALELMRRMKKGR